MSIEEKLNEQPSVIKQMESVLVEKEEIINNKLEELNATKTELAEFEAKIVQKVNELKSEQERFEQEKADFYAQTEAENEKIRFKWEEIRAYEEKLKVSTDEVLAEKLNFEKLQKERLEQEVNANSEGGNVLGLNLSELGALVGIEVKAPVKDEKKVTFEEMIAVELKEENTEPVDEIPALFREFEKEIKKSYSKWSVLEILKERYCLKYEEKEIRFFDHEPNPEVQIVVFRRNAKNDKRLQGNIVNLERVAPEWHITTDDNRVIYAMSFAKDTQPAVVLKRCSDFMKNHL